MIGYLECAAGVSGDMVVAAMIDAGASVDEINKHLSKLPIAISVDAEAVTRRGIRATKVHVGGSSEPMQTFADARSLLDRSDLDESIRDTAERIIRRLAEAEAAVHGVAVDEVRFHEVGITDTMGDVVAAAAGYFAFGISELFVSPVATGRGSIETQHGSMPLPVPAALELLKGFTVFQRDIEAELVTPTGAAIAAVLGTSVELMPSMTVGAVGNGAGSRDLSIPNIVRLVLGEPAVSAEMTGTDIQIEANIDDMNPEFYEYVSERLFEAGAVDVWVSPGIGKRGRPLQVLGVIAPSTCSSAIREVLIAETSTIGVRSTKVERWMAERDWITVDVVGRPVRVKLARHGGRVVNVAPEYWDCAELARTTGLPVKEIFRLALAEVDIEPVLGDPQITPP